MRVQCLPASGQPQCDLRTEPNCGIQYANALYWVQLIIERAYAGEKDHVKHALDLFVDFAAIFVRILVRLAVEARVLRVHMYSFIEAVCCVRAGRSALWCCSMVGAWQRHGMHSQVILIQKQQREEEASRRSKRRS